MVRSGAGGASTMSVAVAMFPVPPFVEVTAAVVFSLVPALVPLTLMENVQDALAAIVAPERLITLVA
jgi:hypothetical protein